MQPLKILSSFIALILISLNNFSQTPVKNYLAQWKKVDELISKKNLPKSTLAEVKKIYALAKKEKQDAQVIKTVVYMIGLQQENRKENEMLGIKEIEKEIAASKEPVVSIFRSLLAEVYWNYFQQNRWKLYNRTETKNFQKDDLSTWSAGDFHKKITELYLQSVKEEKLQQQTKLEPFDALIIKGNVRHLRPTLYDLLANRALDYFKNDERDIAKPAYVFEIDQAAAFDPAADFLTRKFVTKDSLSLHHKALLIYQKLISFHLNDSKPDALLDADIQRLEFVNEKSTHADKKQLFRQALIHLGNQHGETPAAAQAWYLLASEYNEDADSYKPLGDTTQRFTRVKAKEICERILKQKDSSEGKINCYNLLNSINAKEIQFSVEKVNLPDQPFRTWVQYRNIGNLNLRLVKPDEKLKEKLSNYYDEDLWKLLLAATPVRNWQQSLPMTNDYQQHSAEIKVDALSSGEYILLAASDDFSKNAVIGARLFYVSNISYVNQSNDYFVLDRETGQPLANAAVQVWQQVYDYKTSKYTTEKGKQYKADNNGFFRLTETEVKDNNYRRENYKLEINWNNEKLFMDDWQYDYYYYRDNNAAEPEDNYRIFFFTDRSIYRPGQTAFFKGIAIASDKEVKNKVLSNLETKIYLRDANYQVVDSIVVKTNEYGSFSGKFQLPQSGLNGNFSIYDKENKGQAEFSVEEYKRPKFYVEYEKIKGTFKVNDKIKITGLAKAYAGNNIDGAAVKYRVVREPRYIYPWLFWRWWQPPTSQMEIAHGEAKTDKEGKFVIEFEAIPDKTIDKKFEPVFDYRIYADVTDINGETRSGETSVSVSYKSLILNVDLPSSLPLDSLKTISIRTENMAGEFEPAKVSVTISKLKEEKRLIRSRYWQRPDQFVMSKEEYIKNFPHDEYSNENDYRSWEKEVKVFEKSDSIKENGKWIMDNDKFVAGFYVVEISTKDKNGEEVKDVKYIELFDEKSNQLGRPEYLWTQGSKQIEPGEKTDIKLGTSADNLFVVQQSDRDTINDKPKTINYNYINLNNEKKTFNFTSTEADRGGYGVNYFFVKNNRFFQFSDIIRVPWTNKDLKIDYATFRDKTLPGSEEKWKVKITGYKKEQVAAEMLASMYDASLDQFKPHGWSKPSIWPFYSSRLQWSSSQNFSNVESQQKRREESEAKYFLKEYDALLIMETRYGYGRDNIQYMMKAATGPTQEGLILNALSGKVAGVTIQDVDLDGVADQPDKEVKPKVDNSTIQIRKNFSETAFFFPDLRTDSSGAIEFSFTMPEALTKWKFQTLTHSKELAFGYSSKEIVTQKQLMVQPNAPRFLREGDRMEFSSKIVNLTDKEITGQAQLLLFDATTNESVDGWFRNSFPNQYFTVAAGQSEAVNFPIEVPYLFNKALVWRIVARAGDLSDGEENAMPVLTNKMLVTETLPLPMRGTGTKNFTFDKLLKSAESETLQNYSLTVEYTSNPAWYAVQALPYLMDYPYECAEQTWNRYYANSLAAMIANSSPRIKQIFESWKTKDTAALLSNLQKNQELKAVLLEETPWVLEAKTEEQQKKNIALLFDLVRMSSELNSSLEKLKQMQSSNGGFVWFKGGPDDRYITQYIITGIAHLKKLKAYAKGHEEKLKGILKTAMPYLDSKIKEDYDWLIKNKANLKNQNIGYSQIQYLYMRSAFPEYEIPKTLQKAYNYYRSQAKQFWMKQSKYMQGMIALSLYRTNDKITPSAILKSLKETSITSEELGMYWKDLSSGWFWHQAPIETQSLLIEAFHETGNDKKTVDDLRTWLLKNKQTNNWKTTKATAEACYALLLQGNNWLTNEPAVEIKLGNAVVDNKTSSEAGTGYFKKTIDGVFVKPEMGNISVSLKEPLVDPQGKGLYQFTDRPSWGGVYWQYFENLDKITSASTPLKLVKKLFVETNTDHGPVLTPVNEADALKVGDKIKVRIELRVDRDMEYVHMKDMRASCMEPVNVLSSYKWQGGLGYYETTKDASTNFFFSYLRKGVYVFEYPLFVTNKGNFSNGITTIQCMYAPEFSSHSEGIRISVE
ncbi:MAG: alpha-2-macroglobulin [Chitinophagaceae bacterium]|nr:MAG: alpha-2-macroglobulin [Chitinophagaceae bacterium]